MSLISIVPTAIADMMRPRRVVWHGAEAWTDPRAGATRRREATALLALILVKELTRRTSPGIWSVFSDRSDKPIDVDGESILKDHSVGIDGNEPRCAAGAVVFHRRGIGTER